MIPQYRQQLLLLVDPLPQMLQALALRNSQYIVTLNQVPRQTLASQWASQELRETGLLQCMHLP